MTTGVRSSFERRLKAALTDEERRIPVVLGLCGAGRTSVLHRLRDDLGAGACQYLNVERTATTPERFLDAVTSASPFTMASETPRPSTPREAFDAVLAFLADARGADGAPAIFLLDEVMEFRTFESFPGLRHALPEVLAALASARNRFALASRYITRAERALSSAPPQFVAARIEGLGAREVDGMLAEGPGRNGADGAEEATPLATVVQKLTSGRPAYARAVLDSMRTRDGAPGDDPVSALVTALEPEGRLSVLCGHCYELRLHRARGYGALKAILDILAEREPLTLTEISQRLHRTPGSTKDYLSWLDDVDLVSVNQKRYRFRDPLLRVWCRLHCRPSNPGREEIAREVEMYAAGCLEQAGV